MEPKGIAFFLGQSMRFGRDASESFDENAVTERGLVAGRVGGLNSRKAPALGRRGSVLVKVPFAATATCSPLTFTLAPGFGAAGDDEDVAIGLDLVETRVGGGVLSPCSPGRAAARTRNVRGVLQGPCRPSRLQRRDAPLESPLALAVRASRRSSCARRRRSGCRRTDGCARPGERSATPGDRFPGRARASFTAVERRARGCRPAARAPALSGSRWRIGEQVAASERTCSSSPTARLTPASEETSSVRGRPTKRAVDDALS